MHFLHHVDVVQAVQIVPAPAHVLEAAGHVFLAVEVIGFVAQRPEGLLPVGDHFGDVPGGGEILPPFKQVGALFQGKGVDGDVGGVQCRHRVQTAAEARRGVRGKPRDQIHVDGAEARVHRFAVGAKHVCRLVRPSAGAQNGVLHGLGVDAHAVGAAGADGLELFQIQRIRAAALYGEFDTPGQVEIVPDDAQQALHLGRGKGRGGAAADVEGANGSPGLCQKPARDRDLLLQRPQIGLQQFRFFADGAADEAAIGAAGGAEGNADVQ